MDARGAAPEQDGIYFAKTDPASMSVPGFLSAYPNALFEVNRQQLDAFVDTVAKLDSEAGYRAHPPLPNGTAVPIWTRPCAERHARLGGSRASAGRDFAA